MLGMAMQQLRPRLVPGLTALVCSVLLIFKDNAFADCPGSSSPLVLVTGPSPWCVTSHGSTKDFCAAVKTCHSAGQEMISREVYTAIKLQGVAGPRLLPNHYWVGLTDASNERGTSPEGWVWIRDGQTTGAGSSMFATSEPNGGSMETCVFASTTGLGDISCRFTTASFSPTVFCYSNSNGSDLVSAAFSSVTSFKRVNIASYSPSDPGCWTDASSSKVDSRLSCSSMCATLGLDCAGFYWHSIRLQCIVLNYFDANVSLNFTSSADMQKWEKFLRMKSF